MARLRYNALKTGSAGSGVALSLGASLTSSATSVTFNAALTHSNGTAVPTIASPDYLPLEILDATGNMLEIVYLTAYTSGGTTGTIVRGREGTTGVAHSSGEKITHGPTVMDMFGEPPVNAPSAYDDEFDGTSSVTWTNGPTAPTSWDINTTRPSHGVLRSNGNVNNTVAKCQATPGSYPFTITAKISGQTAHGAANSAGIFISPASPTGSSNFMCLNTEVASTSQGNPRILRSWSGTFVSGVHALQTPVTGGAWRDFGPIYLRLKVNSATSVDSSISRDGWNWVTFETGFNPGFTPGLMGVHVGEYGTADLTAHFDWFRVT